jgi:hypothetical protein
VVESPAYAPPAAPSAPSGGYDSGAVVAMMPIPNPGDPGSAGYYGGYRGRRHDRYEASASPSVTSRAVTSPYGEGHPAPGRHPVYASSAYAPSAPVHTASRPALVVTHTTTVKTTQIVKTAPVITPPKLPAVVAFNGKAIERKSATLAAATGVAAGTIAHEAKQAAHTAAKSAVQTYKAQTATPAPAPIGDRATRLASLQAALTDAVGKSGMLTAPASFTANQPVDVSLVLPANFADTLRGEAQKDGLGDAAASVNMTAILSGDGFAVTPDDTQSSPLTTGQPTEFHWTVTAQPGAKGPLHADVGADLLGGGSDKLSLGSVQKTADLGVKLTPRVIGASLLVLIAALVVAWLARGRGPTRSASARRAARREARSSRPLDMTAGGEETPAS